MIVSDLFLTFIKAFSDIPIIPGYTVRLVRPAIKSGRPAVAAFMRSRVRSSRGSTWYLVASARKRACSSFSFAGFLAARLLARLKSDRVSYNSHTSVSSVLRGLNSQAAR